MTTTQTVTYEADGKTFEALAAWDGANGAARAGVLVAPTVMGRTGFEDGKAEALAALGYVGVSIDIYEAGTAPASMDEAKPRMAALNEDRTALARRMTAAWEAMCALDIVDAGRTAAIGFCFGGKCVLDLARTGAALAGVATFHGIFDPPPFATADRIAAKVLALHGWDDPLAEPEAVIAFAKEMTEKGAVWELDAYGHTEHGFTARHRPQMYRPLADERSWTRLTGFLGELFAA